MSDFNTMPTAAKQFDVAATAIKRKDISAPVKWLLNDPHYKEMLGYSTVLNYGGGHAIQDSEALHAVHFDPFVTEHNTMPQLWGWLWMEYFFGEHRSEGHMFYNFHWDIVYLGYVINVIADPFERRRVLNLANEMCSNSDWSEVLVAVRSDKVQGTPHGDGVITKRGTFQKSYTQQEFEREFQDFMPTLVHNGGHYLLYDIVDSGDNRNEYGIAD